MSRRVSLLVLGLVFLAASFGWFSARRALLPAIGGIAVEARDEQLRAQPNYRDGRLQNDLPLEESLGAVAGAIAAERAAATAPPERLSYPGDSLTGPISPLAVTWLGHSTVVLEMDGKRVLFDPMFSENASPISGLGPGRYLEPPLPLERIPDIYAVFITHDHYDHLDMASIVALAARGARFIVPVGIGAHLEAWEVPTDHITELGWWGETWLDGLRVVSTPARHFSGRELTDRFATLWSGWALIGPAHRVYFSGDSGFGPHFEEIGKRLGPFDLSMPETGSYDAAWPDVHLGPEQALRAHRAVKARVLLPVHWSAFVMGNHGWTEPGERLLAAALPEDGLVLPRPGQRIDLTNPNAVLPRAKWWPNTPWRTAEQAPIVSTIPDLSTDHVGAR